MLRRFLGACGLMAAVAIGRAATPAAAARSWRIEHQAQILQGFTQLLSIPNVAADPENLRRNANTLVDMLEQRHVAAKLLMADGVPPVVYGEIRTPGAKHTIVFYAHYDGQPVTASEWDDGAPFSPRVRKVKGEDRVFARSAGDDKAAIYAQLVALDALQHAGIALRANIRFVWEGEEEAGSAHLEKLLQANRELVTGDLWLVCDGPVDQSGAQTVVFGARGDTHLEVTIFGPAHGLHSGHYGNWAPNPAMLLARLLAGMKDPSGTVRIPHFYDGIQPLTALEKQALAGAPVSDSQLMRDFLLGHVDGGGKHLLELLNVPTLNINGLSSGQTGPQATNMIPPTATVDLDLRLVVGLDWREQQRRVTEYIKSQDYFVVDRKPTADELLQHSKVASVKADAGYNAVRTPMDLPIAQQVIAAVVSARGKVIELPTMGGSVPLEAMERAASTRTLTVPIANYDDNQHTANENLRLQNLWAGLRLWQLYWR